jgi:hypothetical protein
MKESSRAGRVKSDDGENQFGNCRSIRATARGGGVRMRLFNVFGADGVQQRAALYPKK